MCTLAAYVQMSRALPLVVAANRDEFLDRPSAEPRILSHDPWVLAGQDLDAGGTWFGINEGGMVVGLLNRRRPGGPDPSRRSRGLLCLEVLQTPSLPEAVMRLHGESGAAYNSFNLLLADARAAFVASNHDARIAVTPLPPGVHLLTNLELNDPTCPRIAKSSQLFRQVTVPDDAAEPADLLDRLRAILSDHTTALDPRADTVDTLCVHLPGYGTRSSAIVVATAAGRLRYWHTAGPPCRASYCELETPACVDGGVAL